MLDYTESPIWANDQEAESLYGYNIDLHTLNLQPGTITQIRTITNLFSERLNPIYQGFPSLWSGRMHLFYQLFIRHVYDEIKNQIGKEFEIENKELQLMTEEIDVAEIDRTLEEFILNPTDYADKKGIKYNSKDDLKKDIQEALAEWKIKEHRWMMI
jgi:hypothetical protein